MLPVTVTTRFNYMFSIGGSNLSLHWPRLHPAKGVKGRRYPAFPQQNSYPQDSHTWRIMVSKSLKYGYSHSKWPFHDLWMSVTNHVSVRPGILQVGICLHPNIPDGRDELVIFRDESHVFWLQKIQLFPKKTSHMYNSLDFFSLDTPWIYLKKQTVLKNSLKSL